MTGTGKKGNKSPTKDEKQANTSPGKRKKSGQGQVLESESPSPEFDGSDASDTDSSQPVSVSSEEVPKLHRRRSLHKSLSPATTDSVKSRASHTSHKYSESSEFISSTTTSSLHSPHQQQSWLQQLQLQGHLLIIVITVSIFILIVAALAFCFYRPGEVTAEVNKTMINPADVIQSVSERHFPPQSHKFWKVIKSNIRNTVNPKGSGRPSCMVFTADVDHVGADESVELLANEIENLLSSSPVSLVAQGETYSSADQRSRLEDELSHWFNKGNRVVVIHDIEKLSIDTAQVFYKFCDDNANPTYPGTIILLTLDHKREDVVDKYWLQEVLRHHWSNDDDALTPLLSRIGNSLNIINK